MIDDSCLLEIFTEFFLAWLTAEIIDIGTIFASDVPTAKCITYVLSIFNASNIKNKKGTVIKPPHIPKSPAKKPTGNAVNIINIIKK